MNEAFKQSVSPRQNGFVSGGFLAENTMLLKLIQAYVEHEDEEAFCRHGHGQQAGVRTEI